MALYYNYANFLEESGPVTKKKVVDEDDGLPVDPPHPDEEPELFEGEDEKFRSMHEDRLRQASFVIVTSNIQLKYSV